MTKYDIVKWLNDLDREAKESDETLAGSILWEERYGRGTVKQEVIANFILSRETAMLEEIEKPLKKAIFNSDRETDYKGSSICYEKHIDEALSIIQRRKA